MRRLSNGILRFNRAQGSKGQSWIFACLPDEYSATQQTILEKGGVSISIVQADASRSHIRDHPGGLPFFVVGISLVVHPRNPHHGSQIYPTFKKWCDEYFYIPHRNETTISMKGLMHDFLRPMLLLARIARQRYSLSLRIWGMRSFPHIFPS